MYIKALFKTVGEWMIRYPLAAAIALFLVILALFMAIFGDQFQIGGILGKLFGKEKQPNTREIIPENRIDNQNNPITPGQSDEQGFTQVPTKLEIVEPTIFSNPEVIVVKHPDQRIITIDLPKGITNQNVKEVTLIKPNMIEIKNNDKGVDTKKILEFLL